MGALAMELRSQTSLLASVLCFALAASVLFRPRKRRVQWLTECVK